MLLEKRLSAVSRGTPLFALALRGYRRARAEGDAATAEGLGVSGTALGNLRERAAEALADRQCITQLYLEAWGDVAAA